MTRVNGLSDEDEFGDFDLFQPDPSIDPRTAPQPIPEEGPEASERSELQGYKLASVDFLNMPEGRVIGWIKHMPEPFRSQFPVPGDSDKLTDEHLRAQGLCWMRIPSLSLIRQVRFQSQVSGQVGFRPIVTCKADSVDKIFLMQTTEIGYE